MSLPLEERIDRSRRFIEQVVGEHLFLDSDFVIFSQLMAMLQADHEVLLDRFPLLRDIDQVPNEFLIHLQQEFSLKLPDDPDLDPREFIRESKPFYAGKGTENLLQYLAALAKVSIELFESSKLIFRLDYPRTLLSGAPSTTGPKPYHESKLGRLRDGIVWAFYVYLLVIRGTNVNTNRVIDYINLNHPAGTNYFFDLYLTNYLESSTNLHLSNDHMHDYFMIASLQPFPETNIYITELDQYNHLTSYRSLETSQTVTPYGQVTQTND